MKALTTVTGEKVYFNPRHVTRVLTKEGAESILIMCSSDYGVYVKEDIDTVLKAIEWRDPSIEPSLGAM